MFDRADVETFRDTCHQADVETFLSAWKHFCISSTWKHFSKPVHQADVETFLSARRGNILRTWQRRGNILAKMFPRRPGSVREPSASRQLFDVASVPTPVTSVPFAEMVLGKVPTSSVLGKSRCVGTFFKMLIRWYFF